MTTKAPSATTGRSLTRGGAVLSSIRSQRTRAHSGTQLTKTAAAEAPDPIDVDVGRRIIAANPNGTYTGLVPEPLLAIPVLEIDLNRDGKVTLPVILAYARGSAEERAFWEAAMLGNRIADADLAEAKRLLEAHGAITDTLERARHYARRAIDALAIFPAGQARAALAEAAEFAVARGY